MMSLNLVQTDDSEDEDDNNSEVFELKFEVEFKIGEIVYLKTDVEQKARIILKYLIDNQGVIYIVGLSGYDHTEHYSIEISREVNILLTSTN